MTLICGLFPVGLLSDSGAQPLDVCHQFLSLKDQHKFVVDISCLCYALTLLQGVTYAVFGLGNKQYVHFNAVGKKIFQSLQVLGASPLTDRGVGDDDDDIEEDFAKWCTQFHEALAASPLVAFTLAAEATAEDSPLSPLVRRTLSTWATLPTFEIEVLPSDSKCVPPFGEGSGLGAKDPFQAMVTEVKELHSRTSDRSCVHVEVAIDNSNMAYSAGDHIAVFAQNSDAVVQQVADLLGQPLDLVFRLRLPADKESSNLQGPFPGPIKLRTALAYFAVVLSPASKSALQTLAQCAKDQRQAARLSHLGSIDGKADYINYIAKQRRSLLEIMQEFDSAKPTVELFLGRQAAIKVLFDLICSRKVSGNHPHNWCSSSRGDIHWQVRYCAVTIGCLNRNRPSRNVMRDMLVHIRKH